VRIDNLFENLNAVIDNRECAGELGALVDQLVIGTVSVLEADAALLVLLDEAETPALVAACYRPGLSESMVIDLVATAGQAIHDGCSITVPADRAPATVLSIPLPAGDHAFGVLSVLRLQPRPWEPEETRAAEAYARLLRLLLRHAAGAHRPTAAGEWGTGFLLQQFLAPANAHADMEPA
jgi:hypothetical protein